MNKTYLIFFIFFLFFTSCEENKPKMFSEKNIETESKRFNMAIDSIYEVYIKMSPVGQSYLGIKDQHDAWGINNDSMTEVYFQMAKNDIAFIKENFKSEIFDKQTTLTYRMWLNDKQNGVDQHQWRYHNYPVNQMFGSHTWFPTFLINVHQITNKDDAEAWISRVSKMDIKIDELIYNLEARKEKGIIAPKFVYPYVISSCNNLIAGFPFDKSDEINPLLADFKKDVQAIDSLNEKEKNTLFTKAEKVLIEKFQPAYLKLIEEIEALEKIATEEAGVWKLPNGEEYYKIALKNTTTTDICNTPQKMNNLLS